eukprot:scaffold2870_cov267-Pinguiococcus_pyrenoidosus.AAC.10
MEGGEDSGIDCLAKKRMGSPVSCASSTQDLDQRLSGIWTRSRIRPCSVPAESYSEAWTEGGDG